MHTCIHTSMHPCLHASMHACIHACMHASMHTCTHAQMHTQIHVCIHVSMRTCIHAHMPTPHHVVQCWMWGPTCVGSSPWGIASKVSIEIWGHGVQLGIIYSPYGISNGSFLIKIVKFRRPKLHIFFKISSRNPYGQIEHNKNLGSDNISASKSKITSETCPQNYPKFGRPQSTSVDLTQNPP